MKVLVIGGGGREHALAWKIDQSPLVEKVYCAPGNPGTDKFCQNELIGVDDFESLASLVESENIDLTVVGPEAPLVDGIVDYFKSKNLAVFGPEKDAARLEGSKVFAKQIMKK